MGVARPVFLPWVLPGILVSWVFAGQAQWDRAPGGRRRPVVVDPVQARHRTVQAFLSHWLESIVKPNLAPLSYVSYKGSVRLYLVPHLDAKRRDKLPASVSAAPRRRTPSGPRSGGAAVPSGSAVRRSRPAAWSRRRVMPYGSRSPTP
jgi:hypothetical protein